MFDGLIWRGIDASEIANPSGDRTLTVIERHRLSGAYRTRRIPVGKPEVVGDE